MLKTFENSCSVVQHFEERSVHVHDSHLDGIEFDYYPDLMYRFIKESYWEDSVSAKSCLTSTISDSADVKWIRDVALPALSSSPICVELWDADVLYPADNAYMETLLWIKKENFGVINEIESLFRISEPSNEENEAKETALIKEAMKLRPSRYSQNVCLYILFF